ncbi:MAG: 30S ribosomal protein S17 [Solirubrobacteraceae bacterium]|jgi:small subunit ribosomal protein S17
MADEPDNETEIAEEAAAPAEDAPEAAVDTPEQTDAPEVAEQADVPEQTDAPEQAESSVPADVAPAAEAEPAERLSSKERRRKVRSTHSGEARPARSPEERHAERAAERKVKAVRRRARRLQERERRVAARARDGGASQPEPLASVHAKTEGVRKVRQGIVVSDKADKTITVRIDTARRHRRYEKIVRSSSTLHAHDENNDAHEGDTVRVIESRPLSRSKRWRLVDVLERAR